MVGDLWERYVKLLDDGVDDGYVEPSHARRNIGILEGATDERTVMPWTSLD